MKTVVTLLLAAAVLAALALGFIFSGVYDVAASSPHTGAVEWALGNIQHASVERRAEEVQAPPLDDPAMIRLGMIEYHEMCVTCHAAPGISASAIGQGLNPYPPELVEEAAEEDPAELFWITKHGIKMTGMPGFGVTHSDEEIWAIVAFLKTMHRLSPEQYQIMVREVGMEEEGSLEAVSPERKEATASPESRD